MPFYRLVGAFAIALLACFIKVARKGRSCHLSKIPGPWYSKYTNIVLRYHVLLGRRIFYVDDLHSMYGGVVRIAPNEVAVADIAGVSQIHKIGSGFLKSAFYQKLTPHRKPGIFAMRDPYAHAARRKLFAQAFSNSNMKIFWEAEIRRKVNLAVEKIKKDASSTQTGADIFKWWTLMANDVIAHLSFGESFDMLELGQRTPYIKALQDALLGGVLCSEMPLVHTILRYLPIKRGQQITRADDVVNEYGGLAIQNMRSVDGHALNLFGQMLAASDDKEKVSLTDADVRSEAGNLIVAGSDTTATTLTYLVWAVLKHPYLQNKLEDEIAQLSEELSLAELEAAPVLNSVITEALRLYGAAPGALPRIVPNQGMTVSGHSIPGGVEVSTQAYTSHRDPSIFSEPLFFDGLRFVDRSPMSTQQKVAFMPFGAGSRVCIGQHLAMMELRLGAAFFFRQCRGARLSDCMHDEMMEMDNRFLISPKGHCCYIISR